MVSRPTQKSSPAPRSTTISALSPARQQQLGQFDRHRVGGGVADLRPVERDFEHRSFSGGDDFVRHGRSPLLGVRWRSDTCFSSSFATMAMPVRLHIAERQAWPHDRRAAHPPPTIGADAARHRDAGRRQSARRYFRRLAAVADGPRRRHGRDAAGQGPHRDGGDHRHDVSSPGLHRRRGDLLRARSSRSGSTSITVKVESWVRRGTGEEHDRGDRRYFHLCCGRLRSPAVPGAARRLTAFEGWIEAHAAVQSRAWAH